MRKRPTIKGRGADIFLEDIERDETKKQALPKLKKALFSLPLSLLDELEKVYLNHRVKKTKISKSDIVRSCLEEGLKKFNS